MAFDPRTLDVTDDMTGAVIPYPGYGGDVSLPPFRRITGMYHDSTMEPAAYSGLSEDFQYEDEPAVPVVPDAQAAAQAPPTIGLSVSEWRQRNGLEAPPEDPAIGGMPDIGPGEDYLPTRAARADAAAETLAPGAFQFTADPWGSDGSLAQMVADQRAHSLIDAKYDARRADIDRNARDPQAEQLQSMMRDATMEQYLPAPRPLIGEKGAFQVDESGAYVNTAPAERIGDLRQRQAANIGTIMGSAVMRQLQEELERIERGTSLDEEGNEAPLMQPMSEDQKEAARRQAMKTAAFALQSAAGGKDYSGFFRETYDPNDLRLGGR